jgi:hypothetical protein
MHQRINQGSRSLVLVVCTVNIMEVITLRHSISITTDRRYKRLEYKMQLPESNELPPQFSGAFFRQHTLQQIFW